MTIGEVISLIVNNGACETTTPCGLPTLPEGLELPDDVRKFYRAVGGATLFRDANFTVEIVGPEDFVRANPVIVGEDCPEDISFDWFVIAKSGEQCVTIDLAPEYHGRCYDSFWDCHGVAGDCAIVAFSFSELLELLAEGRGESWYWLREDFSALGDAYDGR